ncbi:hypothetical protein AAMO2058_001163700 [Amorphochlora amoebiformis]
MSVILLACVAVGVRVTQPIASIDKQLTPLDPLDVNIQQKTQNLQTEIAGNWGEYCTGLERTTFGEESKTAFQSTNSDSTEKSIAILLTGISYATHLSHFGNSYYEVDFRASLCNYKFRLIDYLRANGYVDIDIFVSTNDSPLREVVVDVYQVKPENAYFEKRLVSLVNGSETSAEGESGGLSLSKSKLLKGMELIMNATKRYDQVLITRFDLEFVKPFHSVTVDWSRMNLISRLDSPELIDDNFYLFPYRVLKPFYDMYIRSNTFSHGLIHNIEELGPVNFLLDEGVNIGLLSFFKIVRRCETYDNQIIKVNETKLSQMEMRDIGSKCRGTDGAFLESPTFCKCKFVHERPL